MPPCRKCTWPRELMSGSVSRVTHGVTRVAVEVLRERERCFWGKLQTGKGLWPYACSARQSRPVRRPVGNRPRAKVVQGDDERDEAVYLAAVTSPIVCSAGNPASGVGVERLRSVVTRGIPERETHL